MRIICPFCGDRDESEYHYGGDATQMRPNADASLEDFYRYVHQRQNPAGPHAEWWHHSEGCRRWIAVQRDTRDHSWQTSTHEVEDVRTTVVRGDA